jgi:predicted DNA-binding WGR domain protein
MQAWRYTRVRPERNEFRFYVLLVAPTLWGTYALVRRWGRIGAEPRRERVAEFATLAEAQAALDAQVARREKRGYALVTQREALPFRGW